MILWTHKLALITVDDIYQSVVRDVMRIADCILIDLLAAVTVVLLIVQVGIVVTHTSIWFLFKWENIKLHHLKN